MPRASAGSASAARNQSFVGQRQRVRQRHIRERDGAGARHRARHVSDTVMDYARNFICRLAVSGRFCRLDATALVDRYIDYNRPGAHAIDHFGGDQLRSPRARQEHPADDQIGIRDGIADGRPIRGQRGQPPVQLQIELAQSFDIQIDDGDVRAHTQRYLRRVGTDDAAADDDDMCRLLRPARPPGAPRSPPRSVADSARQPAPTSGRPLRSSASARAAIDSASCTVS